MNTSRGILNDALLLLTCMLEQDEAEHWERG